MPPLVVTVRGLFARVLLPAALVASGLPARAEEATFVDWKKVPQSQAPDRLAEVVCELAPVLAQQPTLVLPLQPRDPRPAGGWNVEGHLMRTLAELLRAGGFQVADAAACSEQIGGIKGAYDKLAPKFVSELGKAAGAAVVVGPTMTWGDKPAIKFVAYDGQSGKPKQVLLASLKPVDLDYLACTPPANRAFIQWCETNFGATIDRGECWDVPAKGLPAVGSSWGPGGYDFGRHLDADETPFPGDPLATKDRRHTMVTYRFTGDGAVSILHQNWNWGQESGRKIGWGSAKFEGNDFWRVRPRQGEGFEDLLVAARARPRQQRGVTKPRSQPPGGSAREAASKETAAAALASE